jgi:hypothetical protein
LAVKAVRVAGIDPGQKGAICVVDSHTESIVFMCDMPTRPVKVGKTIRQRTDEADLYALIKMLIDVYDVTLMLIEDTGVGYGTSGTAKTLGRCEGAITMACTMLEVRKELRTPGSWKAKMRAPADKKLAVGRADELFPTQRALFRGPQGGLKDGRGEAALLALYGAKHAN